MELADAKWILDALRRRRPAYLLAEAYYAGVHRLAFATERFENAFGDLFREFADNLCPTVVDSLVDRLQIRGFADNGAQADAEVAVEAAAGVWARNRMDVQAGAVMQDAALYGDAYVIVWPDDAGAPVMFPQMPTECAVRYSTDRPGEALYAGKVWRRADKRARMTLYYADRVEHYVTPGRVQTMPERPDRFVPYSEEGAPVVTHEWSVVPVFHFANGPGVGRAGRSELATVIPLQDALNKALVDMLVSMEFVAYPQRWATGVDTPRDPITGLELAPFRPGAERVWTVDEESARFGQFPGADLTQHVAVQDSLRMSIARTAGLPAHLLMPGGEPPSGESLKMQEARLVKKARDRMGSWGPVWAEAVTLAMRMIQESTSGELLTQWEAPETRQMREEADVAVLKRQVGVSTAQILAELGYSAEEVERILGERAAETEQAAAAFAAGAVT